MVTIWRQLISHQADAVVTTRIELVTMVTIGDWSPNWTPFGLHGTSLNIKKLL
ncbi:MAG TPA: hypothetical protein VMB85_06965 [Bryobacteraceae bacterium]|nr:hypothetical protein [Bryobacteraceae bacterium]